MKKIIMTVCGAAMIGIASLAQAQDSTSTNFNDNSPVEQSQDPQPSPNLDQSTPAPTQDQTTPPQDPTSQPAPATPTPPVGPTQDQSGDQPVQDGNNAIQQGQSRESGQPTESQTDQSMERPSEMTPIEGKQGPNGEAVFMENGKYYYMNEAGEKTKIKNSELKDKQ